MSMSGIRAVKDEAHIEASKKHNCSKETGEFYGKIENIAIRDTVIECDIHPENSAQPGRISVDMKSKKLISVQVACRVRILQEPCRTRKR